MVAFGNIQLDGSIKLPPNINRYLALKSPNTKVLLSLAGTQAAWTFVSGTNQGRSKLALECLLVCRVHGFDGVDTDWEFPDPVDRNNFVLMHKEIYELLQPLGYSLTAAVSTGKWRITNLDIYDFPELSKYVDAFNLMTYDMHMDAAWDIEFGVNFNAPIRAKKGDTLETGIQRCLDKGADKSKLFVGIPFYGRIYKLQNPNLNAVGSPFVEGYQKNDTYNHIPAYSRVI